MSRPAIPIGTWGQITTYKRPEGTWRAVAQFRGWDGVTRRLSASGLTVSAATRKLNVKLQKHAGTAEGDILGSSKLQNAAELWLEEIALKVASSTLDEYKRLVRRRIIPAIGTMALREITAGTVDKFLRAEAAATPSQVRNVKSALDQVMKMAVRHDAIPSNPVPMAAAIPAPNKAPFALSIAEIARLRNIVKNYRTGPGLSGPRPNGDLIDFVDLVLATGGRIGEILALRWEDVDIDSPTPRLTISGTLVEELGRKVYRKNSPKTVSGHRSLQLPGRAVDILVRRRSKATTAWVFAAKNGEPRAPQNIHRTFRDALKGTEFENLLTPHILRKTVATHIDGAFDAEQASKQLGHSSPDITRRHYIQKADIAPDFTELLDTFFTE